MREQPLHAGDGERSVAYVLKGYPRLSELFIASEISRLEQAGLRLRVYVIKRSGETLTHPIVNRIRARPDYLPATESVSAVPLHRWLARHVAAFRPSLGRLIRRHPIRFVCAAAAAAAQAIRARRGLRPRKVYVKEFLQAAALADRLLAAADVKHLHAHFCHGATTVAWLASMMTGLPFSFTAHAKDLYCESLNPAGLLRRKLAAARFAVTCTEAYRAHLATFAGRTPVHCVYHGLNAELARLLGGASSPARTPDRILRILAVGRLVRKKGFDVLVDACATLAGRGVPCALTIVGEDGPESEVLRRRIAATQLTTIVSLPGPMDQAALCREYRRATVFCLPCRIADDGDRDGIPNVLIEAMACELPVVTTGVSGIPELVRDGVTGLIVPADDPAATADAIWRVYSDPRLAARLSQQAAALVREQFDGTRLATQLAWLFEGALA